MKTCFRFAGLCALSLWAGLCQAQEWPTKPIHFIVAFAPGGPTDIIGRLVGLKLTDILGQQVVVENRGGAGGNLGALVVARANPDGYTVLVTTSAIAVNVSLYANPGYDIDRDFIPVAMPASQPNMIFVTASEPARTLAQLIEESKGKKLAFASPGSGTTPHLTGEHVLRILAKLDITPVHFRGAGPAVIAVVGGQPAIGSMAISGPLSQVKAGKLRALAVSSAKRIPALPDVPTLAEAGFPGVEDYTWIGIFLPAGTPSPIVQKLNASVEQAIQAPDIRDRMSAQAFDIVGGSQQDFAKYVKTEVVKWRQVVRETGARAD
jgi:tripartite-type tricarboxylate transporter receptor subunit TctC